MSLFSLEGNVISLSPYVKFIQSLIFCTMYDFLIGIVFYVFSRPYIFTRVNFFNKSHIKYIGHERLIPLGNV